MSEQQSRARGRGRAQARGKAPQPEHGGASTTGRASTRTPLPGAAGGGAPPPGFRQPPQQQQQHSSGRALHRGAGDPGGLQSRLAGMSIKGDGNGGSGGSSSAGGGNGAQIGRGGMRGRRQLVGTEPIRTRPVSCESKKGSSGEKLLLRANYFKLITKPDYTLYQYHVDMAPQEDVTSIRRALLKVHAKVIGPGYLFDGTHLYTFRRLSPDPLELFSKRNHDDQNIQIIIKLVDDIVHGDYHYLQIYNIIIRKCLRNLDLKLLNRNYYDPKAKIQIPEYQLELWPGYLTTMRQHDGGVLLCTEIINKVLRQDNAYDVLAQCIQYDNRQYQNRYKAEIIGQIVLTQYGNTRTYRVDDVDFSATPGSTFSYKGEQITYVKYYNMKYGVNIKYDRQPMLVSRPKARDERAGQDGPIYLVPELCQMTGLTDNMRANNSLMRAMADHTRVGPDQRQQKLLAFNQRFHSVKAITEELGSWQLQLDKQLVQFEGRRLPAEKIVQGNNISYNAENADWTNQLRSNPLLQCGILDRWVVITGRRQAHDTHTFIGMVQKAANGMRFRIENPKVEEIADDKPAIIVEALEGVLSRDKPKLVLVVVSNNRADRYNAIKKKTLVDRAVPSQVLNHKTMTRKGAMSIATKVAIQLACKIGGAPWSVDMPLSGLMVVGYDVCHDSQNKQQSYGAMVASLNKALSRYYSTVTSHSCGEEVFNDLPLNIGKAVMKYQAVNNALPSRIAVYRDGVGDGQIPIVVKHEIEAVKKALNEIYQGKDVMMAFTIVTKRLNTRLFCNRDNPPAGTVVDDCITSPEKYDFFLVSQSVRQGSVSPTGFNIVHDTIGLNADKLQRLSYKLTHLYYNWSGTVRVPAPCQYAHKLAFLVGQNIHRPPNTELEDFLYFL